MVQSFDSKTGCECPVANHSNVVLVVETLVSAGYSHAKCRAYRGGGVANAKRVIFAFTSPGKTADAFVNAVGVKHFPSAGEDFVAVCLVAYIPHQLVERRVENVMQRHGKFHYTEGSTKMPASHRN